MYVPQRPAIHPGTPMDLFNMAKKYGSQKGKYFDDPVSYIYIIIVMFTNIWQYLGQDWYGVELVWGTF